MYLGSHSEIFVSLDQGDTWQLHYSTEGLGYAQAVWDISFFDDQHGRASATNRPLYFNDFSVGVAEMGKDPFQVYPNPVQQILYVECPSNSDAVEVVDIFGHIVKRVLEPEELMSIPVQELASGLYYIRIFGQGEGSARRFIKE